jgi:molybdate transport system substrate-binding protein
LIYATYQQFFATMVLLLTPTIFAEEIPIIAAAADLKFALAEIVTQFERETGKTVKLTFGSSGNFKTQIEQGAPFHLFLSADENYVFQLAERGLTQDRGIIYAIGRVVLFAPSGSSLKVDDSLQDLKLALQEGRLKRFAIANPEHAPYGRAARSVLQRVGLWQIIQPKLVLGENAAQATQFATSSSSQGGIIPLSMSKVPGVAQLGTFALIPAEWHEPLRQRMVRLHRTNEIATTFYYYLQRPTARKVLVHYGFTLPNEQGQ